MHPMDLTLQASFPTVMMPRFGPLPSMEGAGERLLIGSNGLFIEICRPWLRLVRRIASYEVNTAIPYGIVEEVTELHCGKVPDDVLGEFSAMARAAMPKETGAWVVWDALSQDFRLVPVTILEQSEGHLRYGRPELPAGDYLVMDCHSHGAAEAFFSPKDNRDDIHDVKFAFVLGNCGSERPSIALRLCAKGVFERIQDVPRAWRQAVALTETV
ncbi:PRTRC system protein A [Ralstonia nicotianae]|uniref:PRTRC system protein A n=1 Tax=Ralstonia pseudosolanacearum TaxID=1310165 RepID=UPI002002A26B|nr:PRTRC system protein A [Ralstonia pseudosolanacearum]MCK4118359.1 PRTRC system protein A [Ralstonia pseudosolanacearum]